MPKSGDSKGTTAKNDEHRNEGDSRYDLSKVLEAIDQIRAEDQPRPVCYDWKSYGGLYMRGHKYQGCSFGACRYSHVGAGGEIMVPQSQLPRR